MENQPIRSLQVPSPKYRPRKKEKQNQNKNQSNSPFQSRPKETKVETKSSALTSLIVSSLKSNRSPGQVAIPRDPAFFFFLFALFPIKY